LKAAELARAGTSAQAALEAAHVSVWTNQRE
jgi:hypothetical protein